MKTYSILLLTFSLSTFQYALSQSSNVVADSTTQKIEDSILNVIYGSITIDNDGEATLASHSKCLRDNPDCNLNVGSAFSLAKDLGLYSIYSKAVGGRKTHSFRAHGTFFGVTTYTEWANGSTIHMENDSIILHDIGADGLQTDPVKEYCFNKRTHQKLDWEETYRFLLKNVLCPFIRYRSRREDYYSNKNGQIPDIPMTTVTSH